MNCKNENNNLKIVISVGDESGVGPEIILKALYDKEIPENINFVVVGSKKNLYNTYSHLKSLGLGKIANPKNLQIHDIKISSSDTNSKSSYGMFTIIISPDCHFFSINRMSPNFTAYFKNFIFFKTKC